MNGKAVRRQGGEMNNDTLAVLLEVAMLAINDLQARVEKLEEKEDK